MGIQCFVLYFNSYWK